MSQKDGFIIFVDSLWGAENRQFSVLQILCESLGKDEWDYGVYSWELIYLFNGIYYDSI